MTHYLVKKNRKNIDDAVCENNELHIHDLIIRICSARTRRMVGIQCFKITKLIIS